MARPVWPLILPQETFKDGYSRAIPDQTIRSNMDTGPAKVRYRGGHMPEVLSMTLVLTDEQRDALIAFARDIIKGGVLTFEYPNPENPASGYILARLVPHGSRELFTISQYQKSILWQVSIKMEVWRDVPL